MSMFIVFVASLLCQISICHLWDKTNVYDSESATIQKSRVSVDVLIDGCGRRDYDREYTDGLPDGIDPPVTEVFFHLVNDDISYRLPVANNIVNSYYLIRSRTPFTIWVTTCYDDSIQHDRPKTISYVDSIAISREVPIYDHTDLDGIITTLDNTLDDRYSLDLEIINDDELCIILNENGQCFRVFRWTIENGDIEFNDVSLKKDIILYLWDEMRLLNCCAIYTYFPKAFAYRKTREDGLIWIDMKSFKIQ